jgi:uncharacterized protein (TIGR02996 family)
MDHDAFLGPLTEHPDDDATLLVYADWLEDHGEPGRAAFLRAQERSRRLTHSRRGFLTACREAIALGTRLPPDWLRIVSRPRLLGTAWAGRDSHGDFDIFRFDAKAALTYSSEVAEGEWDKGEWVQVGPLVLLSFNDHYADYEGLIGGQRIRGWAANISGAHWNWEVRRMSEARARRLAD